MKINNRFVRIVFPILYDLSSSFCFSFTKLLSCWQTCIILTYQGSIFISFSSYFIYFSWYNYRRAMKSIRNGITTATWHSRRLLFCCNKFCPSSRKQPFEATVWEIGSRLWLTAAEFSFDTRIIATKVSIFSSLQSTVEARVEFQIYIFSPQVRRLTRRIERLNRRCRIERGFFTRNTGNWYPNADTASQVANCEIQPLNLDQRLVKKWLEE